MAGASPVVFDRRQRRVLEPGQVALEQVGHLAGGLEPVGRILGVQPLDDLGEPLGGLRVQLADRRGVAVADAADDLDGRLAAERRAAGRHRVEHAPQAEQVRAAVERLAPGLLRGHVRRRAGQGAVLRHPRVVDGARQAEIGDLHPCQLVLEHDVRRLDVAVDQPLRVGRGQARGDLHPDAQQLLQLERAELVDPLLERDPGDELHDQEGPAAPLADGMDRDDVRVADRRGRLRLAGEPPTRGRVGRPLRGQHLDRHVSVQRRVLTLVDDPHPAPADAIHDLVCAEAAEVVGDLGGPEPVGVVLGLGRPRQVAERGRELLDRVAVGEEVAQLVEELGVAGQPLPAVGRRGRPGLVEELGDHPVEPFLAVGGVGLGLEHRSPQY